MVKATMLGIKGLSDDPGQVLFGKGFLDEMNPFVKCAMMNNNIFSIARHIYHIHGRKKGGQFARQLLAVHLRHDDVGQ